METVYNQEKTDVYQKKVRQGMRLAEAARRFDDDRRRSGKTLKVIALSQGNDGHVPSIRVAGKWLRRFGFDIGNEVELMADQGQIRIRMMDDGEGQSRNVSSLHMG